MNLGQAGNTAVAGLGTGITLCDRVLRIRKSKAQHNAVHRQNGAQLSFILTLAHNSCLEATIPPGPTPIAQNSNHDRTFGHRWQFQIA